LSARNEDTSTSQQQQQQQHESRFQDRSTSLLAVKKHGRNEVMMTTFETFFDEKTSCF